MTKIRPTQEQKKIFHYIDKRKENLLIEARAGAGKCLGVNTPILMFDGSIKNVQQIKIGDKLMGDDGQERNVLSTNIGWGDLYEIIPQKGDSWICNDVHIMTLHHENKKKLIDIPLNNIKYSTYPNGNYRKLRLQRSELLNFSYNETKIDPYLLGLWLGDGKKEKGCPTIFVHESEKPIIDYLSNIKYNNITVKINDYKDNGLLNIDLTTPNFNGKRVKNILREEFKKCLDGDNIFIPKKYLINSKENRWKLLAGLLDSDGSNSHKTYDFTTKHETLKNDVLYLCRSLGFAAYASLSTKTIKSINFSGEYWRISISGSFEELPCLLERKKCEKRKQIKSVLRTGFKKIYINKGNYYGFTLDGNGRFLLGDFTITHNTSTIVAAVNLLPPNASITFLAFNKHIQEELKHKLPKHVFCYTSHGLGLSAIKRKYGDDIQFDEFKVDHHINKKKKRWNLGDEFEQYFEQEIYLNSLKKLVNLCRVTLTTEAKYVPYVANKYEIRYSEPKDVKRVLSLMESLTNDRKFYDFTDMVYLPATDPKIWMFPQDYVLVDEAQDLNRAQQAMISKILKRDRKSGIQQGRLIAVGDPFQSIYSFAGSDSKSFEWFRKQDNTKILYLTHSFRCGTDIIKHAQKIVPDIKAKENAHQGKVREGSILKEATDGDFVLCRTTMPLVKLFFSFLMEKKKAIIKGTDIGISLVEMTKGQDSIPKVMKFWNGELKDFRKTLKDRGILNFEEHSGYVSLKDKVGVLDFFTKISKNLVEMKKLIRQVFRDDIEGIMLSTIHKAKGLEANRVFIARPDLLPMNVSTASQAIQEKNLEYVAITRSKNELIYDHEWTDVDPEEERKEKNENKNFKTRRKRKN